MNSELNLARQHFLFDNDLPDQVWINACDIIRRINSDYDLTSLSKVFQDVVRLYRGEYPGYLKMSTLYHDLRHIMDVFMCALRLMHGAHLAGKNLQDDEITMIAVAALMHDIGYAQEVGDDFGTGAKYTKTHVARGIVFMRQYLSENDLPSAWAMPIECAMHCTDPALKPSQVGFPNERAHLIGMLVGTADLVGQMADRSYLEKLLLLYSEFKEAELGGFSSIYDLLRRTEDFYAITGKKLDEEFDCTYRFLEKHFKEWFDTECNYYMESISKNMAYLTRIIEEARGSDVLSKLKRRGIVDQAKVADGEP